jgi:hypothetical protein
MRRRVRIIGLPPTTRYHNRRAVVLPSPTLSPYLFYPRVSFRLSQRVKTNAVCFVCFESNFITRLMHSDLSMKPPSTIPAFVLSLWDINSDNPFPPFPPRQKKTNETQDKRTAPFSHPAIEEEASRCCPCCFFFFPFPVGRRAFGLVYPAPPAYEDVDAHTPASGYIGPVWDAASGPVSPLLLPRALPFPFPPLRHHGEVPRSSLAVEPERSRWSRRLALHAWSAVTHPVMLERPTVQIRRWSPAQLNALMSSNPLAARQVRYRFKQVRMAINFTAGYDY